ncbi:hypothetical protein Taro_002619, partial [Colocasia esculenta]|nr:hypothetical protein [Colocasia esculenta]
QTSEIHEELWFSSRLEDEKKVYTQYLPHSENAMEEGDTTRDASVCTDATSVYRGAHGDRDTRRLARWRSHPCFHATSFSIHVCAEGSPIPVITDPTSRTPARDPEGRVATHGSEDPEGYQKKGAVLKGHTPRTFKTQLSAHSGYKSSQDSLSLLLTTHGATAASATRPTPSSRDDEPLATGSR